MIEVWQVTKSYAETRALDDVTMASPDGLVTGFVGPNGAGKSTLLRVIAKLTVPDEGNVAIDGRDLAAWSRPGSTLGVFISPEWLPSHMTVRSVLAYVCDLQGLPQRRTDEVLEIADLIGAQRKRVRALSLGMRQRLGIAVAIVGQPRNLVLDEPFNGLDPYGIQWLRALTRGIARRGGAVLLSSHHMNELAQMADNVVMLDRGRVVRAGPAATFVAEDTARTYVEVDDLDAAVQVLGRRGYACERQDGGIVVHGMPPQEVGRLLFESGATVSELRRLKRSLEETYFDAIAVRQVQNKGRSEPASW